MAEGPREGKLMDELKADLDSGDMTLDERLKHIGMNANEYKAYGSDFTFRCNWDRSWFFTAGGKAKWKAKSSSRNGSPRLEKKRNKSGKRCKTPPTT
jgi:hypothetical protein